MIKKPNNQTVIENMKTVTLTNDRFKQIKEQNDYFIQFLLNIGFTKTEGQDPGYNDAKFKYLSEKEITALGLDTRTNENGASENVIN